MVARFSTQPPTPEKQAIYFCTMDDRGAQLVATVPGIELHIDPTRKYVLVDISPDTSVGCTSYSRVGEQTEVVHKHLPIWQKSVVLVCEEVDTLPQRAADTVGAMKYYLRRVTTLEWDCRLSTKPGPGRWLPFEPTLAHIKFISCASRSVTPPELFCDPAAATGLWGQIDWYCNWKRCPVYKVYLV